MRDLHAAVLLVAQGLWVCTGATYLSGALYVLTWGWLVAAALQRRLGRRHAVSETARGVRHSLEYACLVALVVHMYTNEMLTHASVFVRTTTGQDGARCTLDTLESTETALARPAGSACSLGDYELIPVQKLYALQPDDERLFLTRNGSGAGEQLLACRELGVSCFRWALQTYNGLDGRTPALGMLERIVVHDAARVFLAASYTARKPRTLYPLQLSTERLDGGHFTVHSLLPGPVRLAATGVRGVSEVASLDVDISNGDVLVVQRIAEPYRAPFAGVSLSRFCTPDSEMCDTGMYANTYQFFRIARIAEVHRWSLFALATACHDPLQSACTPSFLANAGVLAGNQLLIVSLLLMLYTQRQGARGHALALAFVNIVCIFCVNWACLLALALPLQFSARHLRVYSTAMLLVLVGQAAYSVYLLSAVGFGVDARYVTSRAQQPNWFALLLQPAVYYTGSVYVQSLAFSVLAVLYTLGRSLVVRRGVHAYQPVHTAASAQVWYSLQ